MTSIRIVSSLLVAALGVPLPGATLHADPAPLDPTAEPEVVRALPESDIAAVSPAIWAKLPPPDGRGEHAAIYDPPRHRMLVFGGRNNNAELGDLWALELQGAPVWGALISGGTPPSPRHGHALVYDQPRDRLIVVGGARDSTYLAEVWALDLGATHTWTLLASGGPAGRVDHVVIRDPVRDRLVLYGGRNAAGIQSDVWTLSLGAPGAWTQLSPTGTPPVRYGSAGIYDPVRDRLVVFGGGDGAVSNEVWRLSFAGTPAWAKISAASGPSPRVNSVSVYDPVRDRMVLFGGTLGPSSFSYDDVWALGLAGTPAWTLIEPPIPWPSPRSGHVGVYDTPRDRLVTFGGDPFQLNDVWSLAFNNPAWAELDIGAATPGPRMEHTAVVDAARSRMIVFGGYSDGPLGDGWLLSINTDFAWSPLQSGGTSPQPRYDHTATVDATRSRMLVFGGYGSDFLADLWSLSLGDTPGWTALAATGVKPSARLRHTAILDTPRDRMIVFGGHDANGLRNDVWALGLAGLAWTNLTPTGTPPSPREDHAALYDPVRQRMLVFGGFDGTLRGDLWQLTLTGTPAWTQLTPAAGAKPTARLRHAAVYDPAQDRALIFGGWDGTYLSDLWDLTLGNPPAWGLLDPLGGTAPGPRRGASAVLDPRAGAILTFGGWDGTLALSDAWQVVRGATLDAGDPVPRDGLALACRPNPSSGAVAFSFEIAARTEATLALYDVAGRRVRTLFEGTAEPGRHEARWDGRDGSGALAPAGVYLCRLRTTDGSETRRLARLR